ncbi:Protein CBG26636 [Caenorhabditis briggsae]|uniref:Protein CBG26636 n=1 Tax=Caenorhabditis briggsae TaxID=6238 RepID=B6IE00_CAEBR|nr:Protein CBG26636 [Caenorhabditis briggsae]CAS01064.1 Protein CBG26636 [Caenorhabditis briggsae]
MEPPPIPPAYYSDPPEAHEDPILKFFWFGPDQRSERGPERTRRTTMSWQSAASTSRQDVLIISEPRRFSCAIVESTSITPPLPKRVVEKRRSSSTFDRLCRHLKDGYDTHSFIPPHISSPHLISSCLYYPYDAYYSTYCVLTYRMLLARQTGSTTTTILLLSSAVRHVPSFRRLIATMCHLMAAAAAAAAENYALSFLSSFFYPFSHRKAPHSLPVEQLPTGGPRHHRHEEEGMTTITTVIIITD